MNLELHLTTGGKMLGGGTKVCRENRIEIKTLRVIER